LRFFFDNTLALAHARAFKALCEADEHKIVHLRERFEKENIPDEEWIPAIAADGEWIVITGDTNIYKNPHRRRVWLAARLTTFFLAGRIPKSEVLAADALPGEVVAGLRNRSPTRDTRLSFQGADVG
jgi:hypothetical protein